MAVAPLTQPRPIRERLVANGRGPVRRAPTPGRIARRRVAVTLTKWLLPMLAAALLGTIAIWPEIARLSEGGRVSFRRAFNADSAEARLVEPRYRGVDERGRPYTLSADVAVQVGTVQAGAAQAGKDRVNLTAPVGDAVLENGSWMMVRSREGVFFQAQGQLDLSGDVVLYRDDGTTLSTQSAAVDLKQGAAVSNDRTHAEGPFGVLDSQGFTLTDRGAVVQFQGPSRLLLNEAAR